MPDAYNPWAGHIWTTREARSAVPADRPVDWEGAAGELLDAAEALLNAREASGSAGERVLVVLAEDDIGDRGERWARLVRRGRSQQVHVRVESADFQVATLEEFGRP